ncbi:MAG: HD domain-containing protein [Planctomycetes bacterium]|nr:HD domain-containing protein [Planctomycetota bacterium]
MKLSERFQQALAYVVQIHRDQFRKGTQIPYVSHLLAVAALALEHGATEDEAIAALLHDAVEDAGGRGRLEDIRRRFGATVAEIVDGCTDAYEVPKPPWRPRKVAYIAKLREAPASVQLVSCCDKLHNARTTLADLRDLGEQVWEKFNGGRDGTLWYYRELLQAYQSDRVPKRLLDELRWTVEEMHRLAGADFPTASG